MDKTQYDAYLWAAKAIGGPYAAGYCMGLRAHQHPRSYFLPDTLAALSDRTKYGDRACGFMDGIQGNPPQPKAWETPPAKKPGGLFRRTSKA